MRALIASFALVVAVVGPGCTDAFSLSVDVQTDIEPVTGFDRMAVDVFRGSEATPLHATEYRPREGDPFEEGVRVAVFENIDPGSYTARVQLYLEGTLVTERRARFELSGNQGVLVTIPREPCIAVDETCDGADQDCDDMTDEGSGEELCGVIDGVAEAVCTMGTCSIGMCMPQLADCDADLATGCETDTDTSTDHCGMCDSACAADASCNRGVCRHLGEHRWDRTFGTSERVGADSTAFGPDGSVYVGGSFRGDIDLGGGVRSSPGANSAGFLLRLDTDGNYLSDRTLGTGNVQVEANSDGVTAALSFRTDEDFGGGVRDAMSNSWAVVAYDNDNVYRWDVPWPNGSPRRLALDDAGNSYVLGQVNSPTDFGGGLRDASSNSVALVSLDANGQYRFDHVFDPPPRGGSVNYPVLGVGPAGVLLGGHVGGSSFERYNIDFGGGLRGLPGGTGFVVSYDLDGNYRWDLTWPSAEPMAGGAVADGFTIGGEVTGLTDFGGGARGQTDGDSMFVVALDGEGGYRWDQTFPVAGAQIWAMTTTGRGDVIAAGSFREPVDFGGGLRVHLLGGAFVAAYDGTGQHIWDRTWADPGTGRALGVASHDATQSVAVTGDFDVMLDFGGGLRTALGANDAFVVKLRD